MVASYFDRSLTRWACLELGVLGSCSRRFVFGCQVRDANDIAAALGKAMHFEARLALKEDGRELVRIPLIP